MIGPEDSLEPLPSLEWGADADVVLECGLENPDECEACQ